MAAHAASSAAQLTEKFSTSTKITELWVLVRPGLVLSTWSLSNVFRMPLIFSLFSSALRFSAVAIAFPTHMLALTSSLHSDPPTMRQISDISLADSSCFSFTGGVHVSTTPISSPNKSAPPLPSEMLTIWNQSDLSVGGAKLSLPENERKY